MLQIENASIAYGNEVLFSGFNLQVDKGEIVMYFWLFGVWEDFSAKCHIGIYPFESRSNYSKRYPAGKE